MYFGTPNGHASTQLEQPMQRGLSADCTDASLDAGAAAALFTRMGEVAHH
jgi:hypothetical protein